MIFEAESRNSDQECLDVTSVFSDVTPLVLAAVKDSESTVEISIQPSVRGRLFKCIDFWRTLPASQFILNVISQGYKIPFFQLPTPFYKVNNASACSNNSFVTIALNELLSLDLIEKIFCAPDIINPLSVSTQRSGKQRLILDLRHVNTFIFKQKFKWEDLSVATQVFDKGFYLFKFDLKSGYHHIEIFPDHRKFLAFAWDFSTGIFRYFQFCVFPFWLSSAPFIFTKILKPLQKSWRSQGIPIVIFLDDGLVQAKINSLTVHADLLKSGFVPNKDKSLWEPVQIISWLGVHLNTLDGTIRAMDERITKLSQDLAAFSSYKTSSVVDVKRVVSVAGQIISLSSCMGSVACIMTRFLFSVVNSAVSWDSEVFLSNDSLCEIEFWFNNVHVLNGKIYWGASSLPVRVSCFSDASDSACGAFVESQPELTFHQNWSLAESVRSSSWRELKVVCLALEAFASRLSNSKVFWYSDNQNIESILHNGSRKCDLWELALVVFQICLLHRISLEVKWIPRDLNVSADYISKPVDFDGYGLNDIVFEGLNHLWGPHTIHRFSCSYNAKLPRFNSRFFQPGCEAVDAFAQY